MLLLTEPSEDRVNEILCEQRNAPFSYEEVGATREGAPPGYTVDHNRVKLGEGEETFVRMKEAVRGWKMFDVGWMQILPRDAPISPGTAVAIIARHYGFWSVNVCRIVYKIEGEKEGAGRYGFAYGTLPEHAERGEERFTVEWDRKDGSVHYDLLAFSRPNSVPVRLGYPFARALQHRFARDSLAAMVRAVDV